MNSLFEEFKNSLFDVLFEEIKKYMNSCFRVFLLKGNQIRHGTSKVMSR